MAQNIDVSIIPQSYLPEIKVSENDDSLRVIRVSIIDENGDAYTIPSGVTATFAGTKPSGLGFTVPCTIDGSAVQFVMENTVCNEQGRFPAEIRLINGEARIGTCNVLMSVEPNPHPDDTTDGDREPLVNEITALLQQITEQAEQVAEDAQTVQQAVTLWTNMTAEAETLPAGSEASASYSDGVLSLGIPTGPEGTPGQDGQDGVGIASVALNADYTLTITLTDGRTYTTTSIRGEQGETGLTPDFTIGSVTTLAPGSQATATITGTDEEPVLNLGIPKGDPGDVSSTGYYPDLYAGGLVTDKGETDVSPYTFRASKALGYRESLNQIVGATVGWNQLVENGDFASADGWGKGARVDSFSVSNGVATINASAATDNTFLLKVNGTVPYTASHKYLFLFKIKEATHNASNKGYISSGNTYFQSVFLSLADGWNNLGTVVNALSTGMAYLQIGIRNTSAQSAFAYDMKDVMRIDLTAMFGASIADKAYTLEQSTPGSGIAWLRSYGFLTEDYYEYTQPRLESVRVSGHSTIGFNQWDEEWEQGAYDEYGNQVTATNRIRAKNFIPCLPNTTYYFKNGFHSGGRINYYDADKQFIQSVTWFNTTKTTPSNACYMLFSTATEYGGTYRNDICINISKTTGSPKNGDYVPYVKHSYALDSDLILRGIPKLDASNNLYYDGDTYASDGTVTRKYGIADLGDMTWVTGSSGRHYTTGLPSNIKIVQNTEKAPMICSKYVVERGDDYSNHDKSIAMLNTSNLYINDSALNGTDAATFKTAMSGVYLVYELATPTTETADPYTQIQICDPDGTEAFTDYGVASGDRDVAIPAGHETFYPEDLKGKLEDIPDIPEAPASNGTYTLKAVRSNSGVTYSWVSG